MNEKITNHQQIMDNNSFVEDHLECPVLLVMTDDVLDVMKVKVAFVFVE